MSTEADEVMKIHLITLILCFTINTASACDDVAISNALYQQSREGTYNKVSQTCQNRPVYKGATGYIYFIDAPGGWRGWMVGSTVCDNVGGIAAADEAPTPDAVTTRWEEVYKGTWYYSSGLQVTCKVPGVSSASLSGGAIAGIVIACIFVIVVIVIAAVCCGCKDNKNNSVRANNSSNIRVIYANAPARTNNRNARPQVGVYTTGTPGRGQYLGPANNTMMPGPRYPAPPQAGPGPFPPHQPMYHGYGPMQPPPVYSATAPGPPGPPGPPAYPPPPPGPAGQAGGSRTDPAYPPSSPPPGYTVKDEHGYPVNVSD